MTASPVSPRMADESGAKIEFKRRPEQRRRSGSSPRGDDPPSWAGDARRVSHDAAVVGVRRSRGDRRSQRLRRGTPRRGAHVGSGSRHFRRAAGRVFGREQPRDQLGCGQPRRGRTTTISSTTTPVRRPTAWRCRSPRSRPIPKAAVVGPTLLIDWAPDYLNSLCLNVTDDAWGWDEGIGISLADYGPSARTPSSGGGDRLRHAGGRRGAPPSRRLDRALRLLLRRHRSVPQDSRRRLRGDPRTGADRRATTCRRP